MTQFNASEILQFAVRIEENGEKIYRHFSKKFKEPKVKDLFNYLANEEVKHRTTFEGMVQKVEKYEPPESYPGEYFSYLRAYADEIIFTGKKLENELSKVSSEISAVDFGIRREVDSILYYLEAKNLVPKEQHRVVDKIVEEERKHFLKLNEIRKTLK